MTCLDFIRTSVRELHTRAEHSGIIADILAGRASRRGVALLFRSLLAVYRELDASPAGQADLARVAALEADIRRLAPDGEVMLLPEGAAYAERIRSANRAGLLGHAYVRYLGDLYGGLIMQRRLAACLGPVADELRMHRYPEIGNLECRRMAYRASLADAVQAAGVTDVAQEAAVAFEMNILLSNAVRKAAPLECEGHA